jgi:hypothetical protein
MVPDTTTCVSSHRDLGDSGGLSGPGPDHKEAVVTARGAPHLSVSVVPDSGTGELVGLAGQMSITIADGKHSYELEYTLPAAP